MPRIHRSTIRIPLKAGTVITDATLSSFVEYKKNKRLTLSRRKPSQSSSSLRSHGDVQSSRTAEQTTDEELELVFHTVDSFTAKRLTYQLNCTRVYALREGQAGSAEQPTQFDSQEQHPGPFSRLNRQFRDTFRRVAKPFSKKTKKSEAGEQEDLSANELDEDKLTQTAAAALPSPIENAAIVKPSGDSPNVASSTVPSVQTTSTSVWKTATSTAEVVVTTPNAVAQPTTSPKTPASFSSSPSPSEPPVPVTLPIIGHTTNAGIVGNSPSSTITHTFHVSHNLPHGTSFQTHGSVIPVLPTVSRAPIHEPLVEPIGVVAAGEADFKLDECEDRILQSLPNPVFDSTKMNRSPPTTPPVPASPNTYSLGIKSTAISPVTPTSPSSLTSFGANTQSAQSERFDRSPLDDSPSIVSTALAKCVKDSENLNASSTSPEMNANREFCADILAQALTVEPEAALSTPAVITMDSTVARSPREIPSKSVAEPQVAVENSATIHSVTVLTSENVALTPIRTDQTTSKQPASVATGALTDMVSNQNCKPNIELNHGQMRLSPTRETSPITAVSQLRSFSSSKTSSYTSPTEAASRHSQTMYAEEDKDGPSPSPLPHTSVSTFGQSESSGNMATALTTQIPRQTDPPTCALSQSASFQSRLRAPMISVPRPVTESDTWSRTPEFPAPYRPLSTCSAHTDLSSTKVTTPELTQADLSPIKEPNTLSEIEVSQTAHMKTVSDSQSNQVSEANAHVQSGDQVSSVRTGPRNSGIRPPCVKVPGGSADSHSTEQTRLEGPLNPSNGSPVTSTRISVPEAHVSTHIKPPEVKVAPSGIKPPSITMNVSGGSRATGIPTPGSVAVNGTGSKNGSVSSVPTATPATGIRLPSRVPKPSTNRA
ncbi:hypothetical protein FGIG_05284 [Fasciola gigantica]|uniref:Uncharacterized protein n=1 Tax=Fasciola gigantica TaxID=46835 RepID=A0A504YTC0_FASGI|nr:hypothetical protein FGIG_05284 [Fasciola gigantica]